MAEARILWDMELSRKPSITTVQAALLLSFGTAINGLEKISAIYLEQAIEMSKDLELFGLDNRENKGRMRKARLFTAWTVFSFQAMFDYYYFRAPHLEQPPQIPLPDSMHDQQWYGEIWVQYPAQGTLVILHLGHNM